MALAPTMSCSIRKMTQMAAQSCCGCNAEFFYSTLSEQDQHRAGAAANAHSFDHLISSQHLGCWLRLHGCGSHT